MDNIKEMEEEKPPEQKLNESSNEPSLELDEVQKLKDKISQVENQYLRLLADYQNLQKRTSQEKEDLYKYAAQRTVEALLPALDTYDYARAALKSDVSSEKIIEDFNLVYESLIKCFKEIGIELIDETGIPFDPVYHEPMHQIQTDELPDHTVMQILKKGYILNKKVIRPALVSVSIKQEGL